MVPVVNEMWERLRTAVAEAANADSANEPRTVRQYIQAGLATLNEDPAQLEPLVDQCVRAVLEALRHPTSNMELAGFVAGCEVDLPDDPGNVGRLLHTTWTAMIDAALCRRQGMSVIKSPSR